MDARMWGLSLGLAAAALWLLASGASLRAFRVNLDLGEPSPELRDDAHIIVEGGPGGGNLKISGMRVPTFNEYAAYQKALAKWNALASALIATAALSACGAAVMAFYM